MKVSAQALLALVACILCVLAALGVTFSGVALFPLGVAFLCAAFVV
jgi:hypothetical protein